MASKNFGVNIAEALNQAVEMQIDSKLAKAKFDSTVEGTILEVKDKDDGVYLVQIQSAKFEAYAQSDASYYEGEVVYINIPGNDFNKQKFIIGRKTDDEDGGTSNPFKFKYPFDDFIPLQNLSESEETDFIHPDMLNGLEYTANKPEDGAEPDVSLTDITKDKNIIWHWARDEEQCLVGSTLGIEMDWQSFLGEYEPQAGDYGIRFLVRGTEMHEDGSAVEDVVKEFFFKTADMYGNPYTYYTPYTQQALINLSIFNPIDEIAAFFWQDHNFVDIEGNKIEVADAANLCLSNFRAQFGLHVDEIENEKIYLFTYDKLTFGEEPTSTLPRSNFDTRTIRFAWVHRVDDDEFTVVNSPKTLDDFNQSIEDEDKKAHIYWYRQTRRADAINYGVPYIAPGSTQPELEKRIKDLEEERDAKLKSIEEAKDTYPTETSYQTAYNAQLESYTKQIKYIQDLLEDELKLKASKKTTYAGYDYTYLPDFDDQFSITQVLDMTLYRERFKAVVVWEGTYETSEPIVFQNINSAIEAEQQASGNEIVFRLLKTETYRDSKGVKQTKLVEDNSIGNFFVYDENNNVIKNDDDVYYSDIYYYIQIWRYSYEQEQYVPLVTSDADETLSITWQFPKQDSMIKEFSLIDQSDQAYGGDLIPQGVTSFNNISAITRKFKIDSFWNLRYMDNIVTAIIKYNGKQYVCQQLFQFGQSGSTGSKYTLRINLVNPASYIMLIDRPFDIEATIYDQAGNKLESPSFTFKYELLNDGPCIIAPNATAELNGHSSWTTMSSNGYSGNSIHGVLRSNYPPVFKVYCDLHDPQYSYEIEHNVAFMCAGSLTVSEHYAIGCPNRIEYKSDGTIPYYDTSEFEVRDISSDKLLYPTWKLEQFQKNVTTKKFNKVPESLIKYLKLDEIYNSEIKINTNTENSATKENQEEDTGKGYYTYKLNPYLTYENDVRDQIAFFWEDTMVDDTATFLNCYVNGVWVCQAIAFARNEYASSILNSWDGQLLIDKEKNAILSRMMSAGVKDSRNRFSGVIMGDWSDYGDASIDPIGLYGFDHGVQTFGFKTDGTGFIGAAGYGQIKFDGTRALISDYARNHYINLNPQHYTINENGIVDIYNGSYSQYFLYSKNKKLETESAIVTDNIISNPVKYGWINTVWADKFKNDDTYDYFVVDPNNGVYMSGGIIARYGMIGDCLQLSSSGLTYQKNNGIIFIGQERARDGSLYYLDDDGNKIYIEDTTTAQVEYDTKFWHTGENEYSSEIDTGTAFNFEENRDKIGRYIFWAGEADSTRQGVPKNPYPNFGIEHNGSVHLNNAYVQGRIRATSLQIVSGDGQYHDINEKFAVTYYNDKNPADLKADGGICNQTYGDLLTVGDLWYDTSAKTDLNNIASVEFTASGTLSTLVPAPVLGSSNSSNAAVTASSMQTNSVQGYICYKWRGEEYKNIDCTYTPTGGQPTIIPNHKGWERLPVLSNDTISELSALAQSSVTALTILSDKLSSTLNTAYDTIRNGQSPVSFYGDGNCLVNVSNHTTTLDGIGTVPAGISIYQLKDGVYDGSSFMLNGKRMGFYQKIPVDGHAYDLPLLAYYNGSLSLAGKMWVGLDVMKSTITATGLPDESLGLYRNLLDGQAGNLILGNGAIQLKSDLDHFIDGAADDAITWQPEIILGHTEAVKALVGAENIPHNMNIKPKITIGSLGTSSTILLGGYEIIGNTAADITLTGARQFAESPKEPTLTYYSRDDGNGNTRPKETENTYDSTSNTIAGMVLSYKTWTTNSKQTDIKYEHLSSFQIKHQNKALGLEMLESGNQLDNKNYPDIYDTTVSKNAVVIKPIDSSKAVNLLVGWDSIYAGYGQFTTTETVNLYVTNLYLKTSEGSGTITTTEVATKEWVVKNLNAIVKKLSSDTSAAQGTANNAYGVAKHHSHNENGLVYSWYTEEPVTIPDS